MLFFLKRRILWKKELKQNAYKAVILQKTESLDKSQFIKKLTNQVFNYLSCEDKACDGGNEGAGCWADSTRSALLLGVVGWSIGILNKRTGAIVFGIIGFLMAVFELFMYIDVLKNDFPEIVEYLMQNI